MAGEQEVIKNTRSAFMRRRAALYALALEYAARALNSFRIKQRNDLFWSNQTKLAMNLMFTKAFQKSDVVGWLMAHGVEYGVYLETANDGVNESIRPIMNIYAPQFIKDTKKLYGDVA